MLSVSTPIWLIGLVVVPVVWWLHRLGNPDAVTPVSATFLFGKKTGESDSVTALRQTNPLWLLRAALFVILVLALSGLNLGREAERHITVWFDDSLSMQTLDGGQARTKVGAIRLGDTIDAIEPATILLRSLSDHGRQLDISSLTNEQRTAAIVRWSDPDNPARPQVPFTLPRESEDWLVSDGADRRINTWLEKTSITHNITVGTETDNTAITAITARRSLQLDTMHLGSVRVHNLGLTDSQRSLSIQADGKLIFKQDMVITPDSFEYRSFEIPVGTTTLFADLSPGDALGQDDTLGINLDELKPAIVDFDDRCGPRFRDALQAHRGLVIPAAVDRGPALKVRCAPSPGSSDPPSITVHTGGNSRPVPGPVRWHLPASKRYGVGLEHSWLRVNTNAAMPVSDRTVLSSAELGLSLIELRAGALDIFLDLKTAPIVQQAGFPLFVNTLVELALERPVLDPLIHQTRDHAESRISGQHQSTGITTPVSTRSAGNDMTPYLLVMAMLLLLADIIIVLKVGRQRRSTPRETA